MKSLKIKTAFVALLLAVTTLVSCKKEDKAVPQQPEVPQVVKTIEGTWIGKYGNGNVDPDNFFAANIKKNGLLEIIDENNEVTGTGTWEVADGIFSAKYKYTGNLLTSFSLAAKYDEDAGTLTGSWGIGNDTGSGDFYWNKQ
jgi:hypothetical protein